MRKVTMRVCLEQFTALERAAKVYASSNSAYHVLELHDAALRYSASFASPLAKRT